MSHHNHDDSNKHSAHHITPLNVYRNIWAALIVLTVVTVTSSYMDFGGHLNIIIAMMIATTKALLVTSYFMGLKYDGSENNVTFYGSFAFLLIFVVLTSADLFMRTNPTAYAKVDSDEMPSSSETVDFKSLIKPEKELMAKGAQIYSQQCVGCHGASGHGDGAAAASMNPKPRNFTQAEGWKNGRGISSIYKTVTNGLAGTPMPGFGSMPVADRMALVHYVRSLGSNAPTDEAKDLSELNALEGGAPKAKLPIDFTIDRMSQ